MPDLLKQLWPNVTSEDAQISSVDSLLHVKKARLCAMIVTAFEQVRDSSEVHDWKQPSPNVMFAHEMLTFSSLSHPWKHAFPKLTSVFDSMDNSFKYEIFAFPFDYFFFFKKKDPHKIAGKKNNKKKG